MGKKKALVLFGTRPEAIKFAPVIERLQQSPGLDCRICCTGQHDELIRPILELFAIKPDFNLKVMKPGQTLSGLTSDVLTLIGPVLDEVKPDVILVQGDTTSAFAGALAGYYHKTKVAHVEAGLRSHDKHSPFPEEINRKLIGSLADFHFTPTAKATENLLAENIRSGIFQVGNTVIDALHSCLGILEKTGDAGEREFFRHVDFAGKVILVTAHRRESFGRGFQNICEALLEIAHSHKDVEIVYATHLNPNVRKPVFEKLGGIANIHLMDPFGYRELVWLMNKSYMVLTDSGGLQEEAPSLGKPVLVLREVTERTEGIDAGTAQLVGTDKNRIVEETSKLLKNRAEYNRIARIQNPYGDGTSARKIVEILERELR